MLKGITKIEVKKSDFANTVAFGSFVLNDMVKIRFNVRKNEHGVFTLLPAYRNKQGKWVDTVNFTSKAAYLEFQKLVAEKCRDELGIE